MNERLFQHVQDGWSLEISIRADSCNPGLAEIRLMATKDSNYRGAVSPETPVGRVDWAVRSLQEIVANAIHLEPVVEIPA